MKNVEVTELESFMDARGWSVHPIDYALLRSGEVDNVHVVSMEPGAVRGNHFHEKQTESVFVFGGAVRIVFKDTATGETEEVNISADRLLRFSIPPGVSHAFQNTGSGTAYLLCSSNHRFSPTDADLFRDVLIDQ